MRVAETVVKAVWVETVKTVKMVVMEVMVVMVVMGRGDRCCGNGGRRNLVCVFEDW